MGTLKDDFASHQEILDPDRIRRVLIGISLSLTSYEMIRYLVVDSVESFFTLLDDSNRNGFKKYKSSVLSLDKHPYKASAIWLKQNDAITEAEVDELVLLKEQRGIIAHEIPNAVLGPLPLDC